MSWDLWKRNSPHAFGTINDIVIDVETNLRTPTYRIKSKLLGETMIKLDLFFYLVALLYKAHLGLNAGLFDLTDQRRYLLLEDLEEGVDTFRCQTTLIGVEGDLGFRECFSMFDEADVRCRGGGGGGIGLSQCWRSNHVECIEIMNNAI